MSAPQKYEPMAGQQMARQNDDPQKVIAHQVRAMQSSFQLAMPKGTEAAQLVRDAQTCIRQTPKLAECDPNTVLGALMTCAQLGLRPGVLGQAYLLPLWNSRNRRYEAQLILGYQGLVELIYRSDAVNMISARVVYSNDEFVYEYGLEEDKLIHRPPASGPRGNAVAYYAIARMKGGGYAMTDVMSHADMEQHRDKYAMAKRDGIVVGPWVSQFDEMAKKTMVRQLAKMLPKSPEVVRAMSHDGAVRVDYTADAIDSAPAYVEGAAVEEPPAPAPALPREETPAPPVNDGDVVDAEVDDDNQEDRPSDAMVKKLHALLTKAGITDRAERIQYLSEQVKRQLTSSKDLTWQETADLINFLTEDQN